MQSITFVLALAVLHAVNGNPVKKDEELIFGKGAAECLVEFIGEDIETAKTQPDLSDRQRFEHYKCFWQCLFTKIGILRDNGDINEQAFVELTARDKRYSSKVPEIRENIHKCKVLLKNKSCVAIVDFLVCHSKGMERQQVWYN